jgi:hypothetical protein
MTYGVVNISLIENTVTGQYSSDTKLVQRSYKPLLATGSGFVADPGGAIVTSPKVTGVDTQRAVVYSVNQLFHERYGSGAAVPGDPYTKAVPSTNPGDDVAKRRQRCYQMNTVDATGGCVVTVSRQVVVQPFVSNQASFGNLNADVIYPAPGKTSDVAIIKVGANSMPSSNLGTSVSDVAAVSTLGFSTTPSDEKSLRSIQGHLVKKGDPTLKNDEYIGQIRAGLRDGMLGGPVVAEKGQVVGFLNNDSKNVTITPAEEVQAALAQAGITPKRGPTDAVYENALHNFNNQFYTAAAANLSQVLKLYPGDALAAEKLAIANQKKGTPADKGEGSAAGPDTVGFDNSANGGSAEKDSPNLVLWGGSAAVVVLAVLLVVLVLRGRRKPDEAAAPAEGVPGQYPPGGYPYPYPAGYYPGSAPPFPASGIPGQQPGMVPGQYPPLGSPYPAQPVVPAGYEGPAGTDTGWEQQTMRYLSPTAPSTGEEPSGYSDPQGDDARSATDAAALNSQTVLTRPDARTDLPAAQCPQCDQPLQAGQQFCGYCGTRVR